MRVFYDNKIFILQKIGGISRYFYELYRRNEKAFLPLIYSDNLYLKKNTRLKLIKKYLKKINKLYIKYFLKKGRYDIFHPTYYDDYFLKNLKKPYVITVYDMIHELYSNVYFSQDDITIKLKKKLCNGANGIITISENTKKDIIRIFNIPAEKIKVIYLGSNLIKVEKENIILPNRYILFTGGRWGYKNFDLFIEVVSNFLIEDKELYLVCTGNKFNNEEKEKLKKLRIENKVINILAQEDEIYTIYHKAECFIFPSLYEGFGIPILEAFESETPLVLSNTSCFPEIAGEAGEYFDPLDKNSMEKAIKNVLYNKERQKELIEKGKERLKKFSWEKTYKETMKFYEEIIEKNKNQEGL